ncbi:MAG: cyclase family protein, partial [Sphaerochaetaceae bacterium]
LEEGRMLDSYFLDDFIKPVTIIKLPPQEPHAVIRRQLLEQYAVETKAGEALIIDTGWGAMWDKEGYVLSCPTYANDAIAWVLEQKPSIFGVDVPCIESSWSEDDDEEKGGLLGELFVKESLLVAPLINLEQIEGSRGTLYCIPLSVEGTSGAPARVFIELE